MSEAIVDAIHFFTIDRENGTLEANGSPISSDISRINEREWHVLMGTKSYRVVVHEINQSNRTLTLEVNGKRTEVRLQSRTEKILKDLGLESALEHKIDSIVAPMPGLIHSILIGPGDELKKGDPVLILEAMKMENVIKSPGDGIVASIEVAEKASVDKNEILIRLE